MQKTLKFIVLAALTLTLNVPVSYAADNANTAFIAPVALGKKDGSSPANAAAIGSISDMIKKVGPGGTVKVLSTKGNYNVKLLTIVAGGTAAAPVTVVGFDDMAGTTKPTFLNYRAAPFNPLALGAPIFLLGAGADNLRFKNMAFKNIGNGAFYVDANIANLSLEDMTAQNVTRFLENRTTTISGLIVKNVHVNGFSKGVIRLAANTNNVLIDNVFGDSQRQEEAPTSYAMGIHLGDTVHNVLIKNTTMMNLQNTQGAKNYWNSDGFTSEKDTHHITFQDTMSSGSTDGGYDLKSNDLTMIRANASDNKRNYRFWGKNVVLQDSVGLNPRNRGGSGGSAQVHMARGTELTISNSTFKSDNLNSAIFHADDGAVKLTLGNNVIATAVAGSKIFSLASGSVLVGDVGTLPAVAFHSLMHADYKSAQNNQTFKGTSATDIFYFDYVAMTGRDIIENFGPEDVLVTNRRFTDETGGVIKYQGANADTTERLAYNVKHDDFITIRGAPQLKLLMQTARNPKTNTIYVIYARVDNKVDMKKVLENADLMAQ